MLTKRSVFEITGGLDLHLGQAKKNRKIREKPQNKWVAQVGRTEGQFGTLLT
jgi:hypothetical protein